jgi:hypothetical protein
MAGKSRFVIAEARIRAYFKQATRKVYSKPQLLAVLEEQRTGWNLAVSTTGEKFIDQLVNKELLMKLPMEIDGYPSSKVLYAHEGASIFQIASSLANKSYLSHYSAIWLNGLTTQIPKIVYVTFEQGKKHDPDRTLTQAAIDSAFSKPQRRATAKTSYGDYTFLMLNGAFTNRLGVYSIDGISVTNLERTLIDITVRPIYAGGVSSVLDAYRNARESLSLNKLVAILDTMNFIYPYFQAIGFYLERAGYKGKKLDELKSRTKEFDFYLTYEIEEKQYSPEWRLFFPKGV